MFICKKKNRSGSTSIVVVEKRKGIYRDIMSIGNSSDTSEIELSAISQNNGYPTI
jgi:hypothetical protein